jgi:phosphoribosylformimino-5-aminoimidazole carboxamide ribotide isomerase
MLIIPAIDLQQGQCVRLKQGQFNQVSVYQDDPIKLAYRYLSLGAKHLHVVDLDGAKTGIIQQLNLLQSLVASGLNLQVGGGIRNLESARACLRAGIKKVVIGSVAVSNPDLTAEIIQQIEPQNIILAVDIHMGIEGVPHPAIHGWQTATKKSLWDIVNYYQMLGIKDILCTDIACDGMMKGPNFALYTEAVTRFSQIRWQASGGIRGVDDLYQLHSLGVAAAILGRMLYETDFDLKTFLQDNYVN